MKIQTGYRVTTDRVNKKTGLFVSLGSPSTPRRIEDMDHWNVDSLLYGLDNLTFFGDSASKTKEVVVERYIDGDELRERIVKENALVKKLFKKFGKSKYWHQIYLTKERAEACFPGMNWGKESAFRVWILTSKGLVRKDIVSKYEKMDEESEKIFKSTVN